MQTLGVRMHQRLPDCHQSVQEALGNLSVDHPCMLILPARPHRHHLHTHRFTDHHHSRNCMFNARRGFWEFRQVNNVNGSHHCFSFPFLCISCCQRSITLQCVLKASTKCDYFQLLPVPSPSVPVVPLVVNADVNSLEVRPDVSANKMLRISSVQNVFVEVRIGGVQ